MGNPVSEWSRKVKMTSVMWNFLVLRLLTQLCKAGALALDNAIETLRYAFVAVVLFVVDVGDSLEQCLCQYSKG